jgi:DMSO reductase anchor subunit
MHPALSVILLTTFIGVGQGLFIALACTEALAVFDMLPAKPERLFYTAGSVLSLLFLGAGLVSSFFHLGHPERAWRSAAQWRTSWLSREVIVLPAFMGMVFLYGGAHWLGFDATAATLASGVGIPATLALGALGMALSLALFICTGMIYACLPFIREWHSPLTLVNYTLLGCASGITLATLLAAFYATDLTRFFASGAMLTTLLALIARSASLFRNSRLKPKSTLQTAIGIKHPKIVQITQGFTGENFNTREFFHARTKHFLRGIKWLFLLCGFVIPILLLGMQSIVAFEAAFIVQLTGLMAERWFFFAQANHPQNLYYQAVA